MMATLKLITDQTAKAHGAAAREQDTYAARTQQFFAEIENLKSDLGTALLPVVSAVVDKFAGLAGWMSDNIGLVQIIVGAIGILAGIILVLNAAMKVATIIQWAMNAAWLANPVTLVVLGILALIAVVVIAYKKFPAFARIVDTAFAAMKSAVKTFAAVVKTVFTTIASTVRSVGNGIQSAWNATGAAISTAFRAVGRFIAGVFNAPVDAVKAIISGLGGLAGNVMNGIRSAIGKVGAAFGSVASKIKGAFAGAGKWLYSIGASIVQGLIDGIGSLAGWVKQKVEDLAGLIPKWARKKLGIASPSKVMRTIGQQVSQGLALGITDGAAAVSDTATKVAATVAASMSKMFKNKAQAAKETRDVLKSLDDEYAALRRNANQRKAVADSIATLRDQMRAWADQVTSSAKQFAGITAAYDLGEGVAVTSDNLAAAMGDRVSQVEQYMQAPADSEGRRPRPVRDRHPGPGRRRGRHGPGPGDRRRRPRRGRGVQRPPGPPGGRRRHPGHPDLPVDGRGRRTVRPGLPRRPPVRPGPHRVHGGEVRRGPGRREPKGPQGRRERPPQDGRREVCRDRRRRLTRTTVGPARRHRRRRGLDGADHHHPGRPGPRGRRPTR